MKGHNHYLRGGVLRESKIIALDPQSGPALALILETRAKRDLTDGSNIENSTLIDFTAPAIYIFAAQKASSSGFL
jgi:hypothetical protein